MNTNGNQNRFGRRIAFLLCVSLIASLFLPVGAFAASQSMAPRDGDVIITNNAGKSDTVYVSGLAPGEIVTIYTDREKKLGSKKVAAKKMDVSFTFSQLGADGGYLYVTVTSPSMTESKKALVEIPAEAISGKIKDSQVTITNNSGSSDTIIVEGLKPKDAVKVYDAKTGGRLLKSGTVSSSKQEITLKVSQLGTAAGSVYISVKSSGEREGTRVKIDYEAEGQTASLEGNVSITNNITGTKDVISVTGLDSGEVITVYKGGTGTATWGKATVSSGKDSVNISVTQLGKTDGTVYITRKVKGLLESPRLAVRYDAEGETMQLTASNAIVITNNASGMSDTIFVNNLEEGDTITVYKTQDKTTTWGKATVAAGKDNVTISVTQLGAAAGSVWISRAMTGANESGRIKADYDAEGESAGIIATQVAIINNANASDTIYVNGLSEKDKVNVYKDDKKKTLLGSATVATGDTSATITVAQLGSAKGTVYLSLVQSAQKESGLTAVEYKAEAVSGEINTTNVAITNNAGIADTVEVWGLVSGDIIKVYRDANCNELLGKGSTVSGGTQVVQIAQLGTDAGTLYLTLTGTNKVEGKPVTAGYEAEAKSKDISESTEHQINVANKTGSSSTLSVMQLEASTTVKVYNQADGGTLLGSGTTGADGVVLVVSLSSLPQGEGFVYVSLTNVGKLESDRVKIGHGSKLVTADPEEEDVEVVNNAGIADTVTVNNLGAGDVVKVYKENSKVKEMLGSATVAGGSMNAVVNILQLGKDGGSIYVSVTAAGKLESGLTEIEFLKETESKAPDAGNISILNRSGTDDEITVSGLLPNDVVKVYRDKGDSTPIGTATAGQNAATLTVYIAQLGTVDGKVYVSVKSIGKNESTIRTEVFYVAESKAPVENAVVVTNNPEGESDIITVSRLAENDIVRVYSTATGDQLLGSAYAGANSDTVIISVEQLGTAAGSIYVSVKNDGKCESVRVKVDYSAE